MYHFCFLKTYHFCSTEGMKMRGKQSNGSPKSRDNRDSKKVVSACIDDSPSLVNIRFHLIRVLRNVKNLLIFKIYLKSNILHLVIPGFSVMI